MAEAPANTLGRSLSSLRARPTQPMGPRIPQRGLTFTATGSSTTDTTYSISGSSNPPPLPPSTFMHLAPPQSDTPPPTPWHATISSEPASPSATSITHSPSQPTTMQLPSHHLHPNSNGSSRPSSQEILAPHSSLTDYKSPQHDAALMSLSHQGHFADRSLPVPPVLQGNPLPVPTRSPSPKPVVRPIPKPIPLIPPKPVNLDSASVPWKPIPLEAALWTFSSRELQALVSRSIRSSAKESFIRLLSLNTLDQVLPPELERLESARATTRSKYRFLVHRRNMLLQALNSSGVGGSAGAASIPGVGGSITGVGSNGSALGAGISGLPNGSTSGGEDEVSVVSKLTHQLSQTIVDCEEHLAELVGINDQISQINKLLDVHWASALAIALRKLNGSYGKRTQDLRAARERIETLEAELEDAWRTAEQMARELDEQDAAMANASAEGVADVDIYARHRRQGQHASERPIAGPSEVHTHSRLNGQDASYRKVYLHPSQVASSSSRLIQSFGQPQAHGQHSQSRRSITGQFNARGFQFPPHERSNSGASSSSRRTARETGSNRSGTNAQRQSGHGRRTYAHDVPSSVVVDEVDNPVRASARDTNVQSPSFSPAALARRSPSPNLSVIGNVHGSPMMEPSRLHGHRHGQENGPIGVSQSRQQYPYTPSPPPARSLEQVNAASPRSLPHSAPAPEAPFTHGQTLHPAHDQRLHASDHSRSQNRRRARTGASSHSHTQSVGGSESDIDEEEAVIARAEVVSVPSPSSQSPRTQSPLVSPALTSTFTQTPPRSPGLPAAPESVQGQAYLVQERLNSQDLLAASEVLVNETPGQQQQSHQTQPLAQPQSQQPLPPLTQEPLPHLPQVQSLPPIPQEQPLVQQSLPPIPQEQPLAQHSLAPPQTQALIPLHDPHDPDSEYYDDAMMMPPPPYAKNAADDPHHQPGRFIQIGEDSIPIELDMSTMSDPNGVIVEAGSGVGADSSGEASTSSHAAGASEALTTSACIGATFNEENAVSIPPPRSISLNYSHWADDEEPSNQLLEGQPEPAVAEQALDSAEPTGDNVDISAANATDAPAQETGPFADEQVLLAESPAQEETNTTVDNDEDNDAASIHSARSEKSNKSVKSYKSMRSASRLSVVSAARMRSHRASKGSLRLPKGFKLFCSTSSASHSRAASINGQGGDGELNGVAGDSESRPPVPDIPREYLQPNSDVPQKESPSRPPPVSFTRSKGRLDELFLRASNSFLDMESPVGSPAINGRGKEKQQKIDIDDIEITARDIPEDGLQNSSARGRPDEGRSRTRSQQFGTGETMDDMAVNTRRVARPIPGRSTVDDIGIITKSRMFDEDEEDAPLYRQLNSSPKVSETPRPPQNDTAPSTRLSLHADTQGASQCEPVSASSGPQQDHPHVELQSEPENIAQSPVLTETPPPPDNISGTATPSDGAEFTVSISAEDVDGPALAPGQAAPSTTEASTQPAPKKKTSQDDNLSRYWGLPSGAAAPSRTSSFISAIHPLVNLNFSNPDLTLYLPADCDASKSADSETSSAAPYSMPHASASTPGLVDADDVESTSVMSASTVGSMALSMKTSTAASHYRNPNNQALPKLPSIQKLKTLTKRYSSAFPRRAGKESANASSSGSNPDDANAVHGGQGSGPSRLGIGLAGKKMQSRLQSVTRWGA